MANGNPRTNHEGYSDPTAYEAIKNTEADDERFHKLLNTIFTSVNFPGFIWRNESFSRIHRQGKFGGEINVQKGLYIGFVITAVCY